MMNRLKLLLVIVSPILLILSGCAGLGLNKQATLMPDEISVSIDSDPDEHWQISEVTGGLKWKLK